MLLLHTQSNRRKKQPRESKAALDSGHAQVPVRTWAHQVCAPPGGSAIPGTAGKPQTTEGGNKQPRKGKRVKDRLFSTALSEQSLLKAAGCQGHHKAIRVTTRLPCMLQHIPAQ